MIEEFQIVYLQIIKKLINKIRKKTTSKLNYKEEKKILDFINFLKTSSRNYFKLTEIFHFAEKHGFHFTQTHFYSPIPTVYELDDKLFDAKENIHFDWNEKSQLELLEKLKNFSSEYKKLIDEKKFDDKKRRLCVA